MWSRADPARGVIIGAMSLPVVPEEPHMAARSQRQAGRRSTKFTCEAVRGVRCVSRRATHACRGTHRMRNGQLFGLTVTLRWPRQPNEVQRTRKYCHRVAVRKSSSNVEAKL